MSLRRLAGGLVGLLVLVPTIATAQVVAGQRDDFQGGTTMGWGVGDVVPTPPTVVAGGAGGAGDLYLRLTSTGLDGPGGRMSAFNTSQWAGNYLAAGITSIGMEVNNFGPSDLYLRLLVADALGGPPSNIASSLNAVFVPANSGWMQVFFPVGVAAFGADLGSVAAALAGATELRIFHNPSAGFGGPPNSTPRVNAVLGVDDITAIGMVAIVPEPSTLLLLGVPLLVVLWRRRRA
jgi:hypothetical protein